MSGMSFDATGLFKGFAEHEMKMKAAVKLYGDTAGKKLEAHAKKNKPWEDRTGNAKNSIQGGAEDHGSSVDIYVAGNMEYSPYLEFAMEKRFAILWPTVEELAPDIIRGMSNLLNK